MVKNRAIIRVSGTDKQGAVTTADFTSDAIEMGDFTGITLSFWGDSLTFTGASPTVTVEVSNDTDVDSFVAVTNATNVLLAVALQDFTIEFEYFRVVYTYNTANAGTIGYELRKI